MERKNLKSAYGHPKETQEKIDKEVSLGRIVGPFEKTPISNLNISPIGIIPKPDQSWRLITHLSYPNGKGVSSGIPDKFVTVKNTLFDKVTYMIFQLGKNTLLAKRDMKSAFRLLPVHPEDYQLIGIKINGKIYVDKFLPMGAKSSCALFEKISTFLHWAVSWVSKKDTLDHYLDDFILAGQHDTDDCQKLIETFTLVCNELGVPIAEDKSVGPTTVIIFLGLEIDTANMVIRIPLTKIQELLDLLMLLNVKNKVTLKELQSLTGKFFFFLAQ